MSVFKAKKYGYLAAVLTALVMVAAQGCSDSTGDQAAPSGGAPGAGSGGSSGKGSGASGKGNTNGGATSKAGATSNGGETSNGGAAVSDSGAGGEPNVIIDMGGAGGEAGTPNAPDCRDSSGCYSCTPTTNEQFLNHCIADGCPASFDNSTLAKLDKVGTL
jgi:hypothetical protein